MAKKKAVPSENGDTLLLEGEPTREAVRERIRKEITAEFGENICVKGRDIIDRPKMIVPFSPAIDPIIGGGVPEGSWIILSGKPKFGKTVTALSFAANCQKKEYGNRNAYFFNIEGRVKARDLLGQAGLDADSMTIFESTEDKILSSQDYLTIAERVLMTDKGAVLILDSISQLCDAREMVGGIGTQTRGGGAILFGQFTKQMCNVVPVKNSFVICIMHLIANTSGYGPALMERGGNLVQYAVDVKLLAEKSESWTLTEKGPEIGKVITWKAGSTALQCPPNGKTESYIRYGLGIDYDMEYVVAACDIGLIETKGTWMYCNFMLEHPEVAGFTEWNEKNMTEAGFKQQGKEKMRKHLIEHPEWMALLKKELEAF